MTSIKGAKVPLILSFAKSLKLTWVKNAWIHNVNPHGKFLLTDKLEKWGYSNIWQLRKEGLSTAMHDFNNFWQGVMLGEKLCSILPQPHQKFYASHYGTIMKY